MALRIADVSELAYGGLVTGMKRWDDRVGRVGFWKKSGTYAYLVPGVIATAATAMGWMRRYDAYTERLAHGFIYGFPEFVLDLVAAYQQGGAGKSAAIREAEAIVRGRGRSIRQTPGPGFQGLETY